MKTGRREFIDGIAATMLKPGVEIAWNAATGKIQPKEM